MGGYPQNRDAVYNELKAKLIAGGMTLDDGSQTKLSVVVSALPSQKVSYRHFGSRHFEDHTVTPQQTIVQYQVGGKPVWVRRHTFMPNRLQLKQGETVEQALQRVTQAAIAVVGKQVSLPRFLATLPHGMQPGKSDRPESE